LRLPGRVGAWLSGGCGGGRPFGVTSRTMQKLMLIVLSLAGLLLAAPSFGADTNQVATNQVSGGFTGTNAVPRTSDAELQAAAQQVWHKLVVFGVLALLGAVVVAGFALYGAYRKFGVPGVLVLGAIIAFGVFALGGLLLIF
jgi:hypothetical protein